MHHPPPNHLAFTKMHTLGNDFVIIDLDKNSPINLTPQSIATLSHRKTHIGFNQLLLVQSQPLGFKVTIYNQDGSQANHCGNGLLALAQYCRKHYPQKTKKSWHFSLNDRTVSPEIIAQKFYLNMGQAHQIKMIHLPQPNKQQCPLIHLGNEHLIVSAPTLNPKKLKNLGAYYQTHWPNGLNVHCITQQEPNHLTILSYERGAGPTLACGSGACAAAYVQYLNHQQTTCHIHSKMGTSIVHIKNNALFLHAPATLTYEGQINLKTAWTAHNN
jgi:diaminopimelate epimerase